MTELGLQTILYARCIYTAFFVYNYSMNNNILINLLINTKNKKCKNYSVDTQNRIYIYKIRQIKLKIYTQDKLASRLIYKKPNIFAEYAYYNQRFMLYNLANKVCTKLNKNVSKYRGVKNTTFIEFVAENIATEISAKSGVDIIKFIAKTYNFNNFYKKELLILPALIVAKLLQKIIDIATFLSSVDRAIKRGSNYSNFIENKTYSDAELYGIIKFNKNLLKFSMVPTNVFYHGVFCLIKQIEECEKKLTRLIDAIIYLNNKFKL